MVDRHDLFLDGSPRSAASGAYLEVDNPATGGLLYEVNQAACRGEGR